MALSALAEKQWTTTDGWTDATPVYPVGPIEVGGSDVSYIDVLGRLPFDKTFAVVVHVSATPTGTGANLDVAIESHDDTAFSGPTLRFSRTGVCTATSGRKGDGTGFHLLGYVTGPMARYLRFKLTPNATDHGAVSFQTTKCYLMPDFDSSYAV